jgi:outer membrane protein assembly factor BamB
MTILLAAILFLSAGNWPQWRGPEANGVSTETNLPTSWGANENIDWKVKLPGRGMSTPIIWEDRVFLTSQIGRGLVEQQADPARENEPVSFVIQCFRRTDGKLVWEKRIAAERPLPPVHPNHNLSSPSCITDGERVYAWFGTGQLICFNLDGRVLWERSIGKENSPFKLLWGHGSSPALHKNFLYLLCDHDPAAYLLALDKITGKTLWKTDRGKGLRSYSTPYLVKAGDRYELLVNSNPRIDAYDAENGQHLWYADEFNRVPVPTPVTANGIIYTNRGYSSGPYMAIRPGGKGDVGETQVIWRVPTGAPYVSSLLYYRDLLYLATEAGIVRCVEPKTGETIWVERIGGNFSASPVGADGKIYLLNEDGETVVLAAGRKCQVLARNALNEPCRASLAIAKGQIFIRSDLYLYCIGK